MRRVACLAVAACLAASQLAAQTGPAKESRRARSATVGQIVLVLTNTSPKQIFRPEATYIAPHLAMLRLGESDSLRLSGRNDADAQIFTKVDSGKDIWGIAVTGDRAFFTLTNASGTAAYEIDRYAAGLKTAKRSSGSLEQICGKDDTKEARCYEGAVYRSARSVARLLIRGTRSCTGWLIGDQGHMLTNEHCIHDQNDANTVQVEFMAEGATCAVNCKTPFACPGTRVATSARLLDVSKKLDYALIKLDPKIATQFGFLRVRRRAEPEVGETIYIPQHPLGMGKRIAVESDDLADELLGDLVAHITNVDAEPCEGGPLTEIGYTADTDEGSSGAPILATKDNLVVALHHCGGCPNRAIPISRVIAAIASQLPASAYGD